MLASVARDEIDVVVAFCEREILCAFAKIFSYETGWRVDSPKYEKIPLALRTHTHY